MAMVSQGEYTISSFCRKFNNEQITSDDCFLKVVFKANNKRYILTDSSLLSKYKTELSALIEKRVLTDDEYVRWRCNPKRMSYDLYGTTEFWFLLLHANELYSVSEFDLREVYIYSGNIFRVVSKILDKEQPYVNINDEEVSDNIKS